MKLVIVPTLTRKFHLAITIPSLSESLPFGPVYCSPLQSLSKPSPLKWWLPFGCKSKGYMVIDGVSVAARCGSRGCLPCFQSKLRKWTQTAMIVKKRHGEGMYGIIVTPKVSVDSPEDVDSFLSNVRKMLKSWERSVASLGAAWFVAECVVDWEKPPTSIPCPVLESIPDTLEKYTHAARETIEGISQHGENCPYCRGRGVLPSVHLHAHIAMMSKAFYWGKGKAPKEQDYPQTFNNRGFRGLLDDHDLGFGSVQIIQKRRGMAEYMAKGMLRYLEKGSQKKDGAGVDWDASQQDNLVAHAVYGRRKSRSPYGRAYGIKRSLKDVSLDVGFGGSMNGYTDGIEGADMSPAALSLDEGFSILKNQQRESYRDQEDGVIFDVLEVSKRLIQSGDLGRTALNVLTETQVGSKPAQGFTGTNLQLWTNQRTPQPTFKIVRLGRTSVLGHSWDKAPVIHSRQWWSYQHGHGVTIGRGAAAVFIAGKEDRIPKIISILRDSSYIYWREEIERFQMGMTSFDWDEWGALEKMSIPALPQLAAK